MSKKPRRKPVIPVRLTKEQAMEITTRINHVMGVDRLWVLAYADLDTGHNHGLMSNLPDEGAHRQMLELALDSLGDGSVVEPMSQDS